MKRGRHAGLETVPRDGQLVCDHRKNLYFYELKVKLTSEIQTVHEIEPNETQVKYTLEKRLISNKSVHNKRECF